jgi:hypothetical protein
MRWFALKRKQEQGTVTLVVPFNALLVHISSFTAIVLRVHAPSIFRRLLLIEVNVHFLRIDY